MNHVVILQDSGKLSVFKIPQQDPDRPILKAALDISKNKYSSPITSYTSMSISLTEKIYVSSTDHSSMHLLHVF